MKKILNLNYLLLLILFSCRKPYNPPAIQAGGSYLVVEGVINSGNDSTFLKISRTVNINAATTTNPVLGAKVSVEAEGGGAYPLLDIHAKGIYSSGPLNLVASKMYRLRITTSNDNQYLSDFLTVKPTPPIDSIGFTIKDSVVTVYTNTHDAANNTHYYRWDYTETWMFHSKYYSFDYVDTNSSYIKHRFNVDTLYHCFGNDTSSNILIGSTTKLSQDIVYQSPLTHIPLSSEKWEDKYSILVKQYALTGDAYTFYQNLKKNTEQLGSIFDALPSQINGNIHSINNNEPIIGYITITNIQSKRIFITADQLPPGLVAKYPYDCEQDTALMDNHGYNDIQSLLINPPRRFQIITADYDKNGSFVGWLYSTPDCIICTLRGTNRKPSFWK